MGGQGGCERRIEVFGNIKKNGGGSGGQGGRVGLVGEGEGSDGGGSGWM